MLAIYDNNGNLINETSNKAAIVGSLYCLEVTIPEGKLLDHIDVSTTTHLPVFVDVPKSEQEMTIEQIKKAVPNLISIDGTHTKAISTIQNDIAGALQRIAQLENRVKKLEG